MKRLFEDAAHVLLALNVALHEPDVGMETLQPPEVERRSGAGQVVENHDGVAELGETPGGVRADESGPAGDEKPLWLSHFGSFYCTRTQPRAASR